MRTSRIAAYIMGLCLVPAWAGAQQMPSSLTDPEVTGPTAAEAALKAAEAAHEAAEAAKTVAEAMRDLAQSALLVHGAPTAMPELSPWSYRLGLAALAIGGNATSWNVKLDAGIDGHWRDWNAQFRANGVYGKSKAEGVENVNAAKAEVSARGQRNYNPVLGVYMRALAGLDQVANVSARYRGDGGLSLLWWEEIAGDFLRSRLRTDLAFSVLREYRHNYFEANPAGGRDLPPITAYGPTLTAAFRYGLNRSAYFTEEFELFQDVANVRDFRVTSVTGLLAQLRDGVGLNVTFTWRHIGSPAGDAKPDDFELGTGLNWAF